MLVFEWCGLKCLLPADLLSKHNACPCAHRGKVNNGSLVKEPQLAGDELVGWRFFFLSPDTHRFRARLTLKRDLFA